MKITNIYINSKARQIIDIVNIDYDKSLSDKENRLLALEFSEKRILEIKDSPNGIHSTVVLIDEKL